MPTNKENVLDDPLMFLSEVEKLTRLSGTTIWRRERAGKFPPRRKQGHYSVWFRSEIISYLEALRADTSGPAPANVNASKARRAAAGRRRAASATTPVIGHIAKMGRAAAARPPGARRRD
jgi:predicted DNA-binding transcriptional regulator AlpA